jgi:hypothetical protein
VAKRDDGAGFGSPDDALALVEREAARDSQPAVEVEAEVIDDPSVVVGALTFTRDRLALVRDGDDEAFSIERHRVKDLRLADRAVSDHPLRDVVWGVGLLVSGVIVGLAGAASFVLALVGLGVAVLGLLMLRHAVSRTTVVQLSDRGTQLRLDVGEQLQSRDRIRLRRRLRRLGWPARRGRAR